MPVSHDLYQDLHYIDIGR